MSRNNDVIHFKYVVCLNVGLNYVISCFLVIYILILNAYVNNFFYGNNKACSIMTGLDFVSVAKVTEQAGGIWSLYDAL